jgi:hypothetical protein
VSAEEVESILERLAAEAPDPGRVLPGGGDLLGAILDDLAFETGVDLDAARVALLAAWHELHDARGESAPAHQESAADPDEAGASVPRDVASAVAEFDRKRRAGAPLEEAIRELERDLDLDSAESGGLDDSDGPAPDFPGVVGAMVEEFLWDEERQGGRAAADKARILRGLGRSAAELSLFESLGSRELVDYACRWSIEVDRLREPTDAERLVDALARFCAWAEENHDVPLQRAMAEILPRLRASLPRLARANRACTAEPVERAGAWYAFEQRRGASEAELVDLKGAPSEANVDPEVLEHLRPGDWIRGRREGPEFHVAACHPHELRPILGQ